MCLNTYLGLNITDVSNTVVLTSLDNVKQSLYEICSMLSGERIKKSSLWAETCHPSLLGFPGILAIARVRAVSAWVV